MAVQKMTTAQKLKRLRNYRTRYELVAEHADGRRLLIRYTSRQGRRGLFDALAQDAERLCKVLGADAIHFAKRAADGGTMGEWRVRFSGRTQRESIIDGELPFYADSSAAAPAMIIGPLSRAETCATCGATCPNTWSDPRGYVQSAGKVYCGTKCHSAA